MIEIIVTAIIELLIVVPIIMISLDRNHPKKATLLILFFGFYILNIVLIRLPYEVPALEFISGDWNWSGKIYAILGSLIFFYFFRKYFSQNIFLTLKQKKGSIKPNLIITLIVLIVGVLMGLFLFDSDTINIETLGFQLTMPGFDEEIAFRGIMIGILATVLKDKLKFMKWSINPSIWVTGILFGLVHGFQLNNWNFSMDWMSFSYTFLFGLILGWMTLKSRSVLIPIISHNASNFLVTIVTMIK